MKTFFSLKAVVRSVSLAATFFAAAAAYAVPVYSVNIDTTSIVNNSAGPFYLDLTALYGSGPAQTITVSNFSLTGGGLLGTGTSGGAVAGTLGSSLMFNPSASPTAFLNEFYQQFASTVTHIAFTVGLTTNGFVDTPTSFSVSILDSNLNNIPTTGFSNSLLLFSLDGANPSLITDVSTGLTGGVTARASVPDTASTLVLTALGLVVAAGFKRQLKAHPLAS